MPAPSKRRVYETDPTKLSEIELNKIIPLAEAVKLSSVSDDGWRRHYAHRLVRLTPKRVGVRLRHALFID
jgi:hypothetical protein